VATHTGLLSVLFENLFQLLQQMHVSHSLVVSVTEIQAGTKVRTYQFIRSVAAVFGMVLGLNPGLTPPRAICSITRSIKRLT